MKAGGYSNVRVYEIRVLLKSPAILTLRRTGRGFTSTSSHIQASTLRGAILSSLYWNGRLTMNILKSEDENPKLIASPAYPVVEGVKFYPSHPFIYECKQCRAEGREAIFNNGIEATGKILEERYEEAFRVRCGRGHIAVISLHPRPVGKVNGSLKTFKCLMMQSIQVAIGKSTGASMKGMLYSYEAAPANQEFWATVLTPYDVELKNLRIWVGRGKSRGFGEAVITEALEIRIGEEAEKILGNIKAGANNSRIVLYAVSPLIACNYDTYSSFPRKIELGAACDLAGIPRVSAYIEVEKVIGRTFNFWAGWDMRRNKSKPLMKASQAGSIVIARIRGELKEAAQALAALEYTGTIEPLPQQLTVSGVNMLAPTFKNPIVGGG